MTNFEAAIIGAGPTGLVAALALAHKGVEVAVVAPPMLGADRSHRFSSPSSTMEAKGLPPDPENRNKAPAAASPRPSWGRDRVGGIPEHPSVGVPPTPSPSPQGGGESALRLHAAHLPNLPSGCTAADPSSRVGETGDRLIPDPTARGLAPADRPPADHRTTALIGASIALLGNLGAWEACAAEAAPIAAVRLADDRQGLLRAPEMLFRAAEIGLDSFGANLPNPALLGALGAAAKRASRLTWVETAAVTDIAPAVSCVRLTLAEGGSIAAGLAVAADGRASRAPAAAGIAVRTWDYPQAAVVASFSHSRPHDATVNELHRPSGPLTTVPLPGRRSALVWVESPAEARRLAGLADAAFAAELEERLQGVLGSIGEAGPRAVHALGGRRVERMAAARVALVGEAAHVVPPIGAQGLNLGLRDAAALADCVAEAQARGEDIGGDGVLAAYDQARRLDVLTRSVSIDLLNRSLLMDILPVEMLRGLTMHALASFPPLRQALMQAGMGQAGPLPSLMRG